MKNSKAAYTLIEVLFAVGILLVGVAAAASLALALTAQEEISWKTSVALNHQEQAARLWQLGLTPAEVSAIIPPAPTVTALTITETRPNISGIGLVDQATCVIQFRTTPDAGTWNPLSWTAGSQSTQPTRTNSVTLVRPDTR